MGEGLSGAWRSLREEVSFTGAGRGPHPKSVAVVLEKTFHLSEHWLCNEALSML